MRVRVKLPGDYSFIWVNIDPLEETGESLMRKLDVPGYYEDSWTTYLEIVLDGREIEKQNHLSYYDVNEQSLFSVILHERGGGGNYGFDFNGLRNPITESFPNLLQVIEL